jgi:hypothetical protein
MQAPRVALHIFRRFAWLRFISQRKQNMRFRNTTENNDYLLAFKVETVQDIP